MGKVKLVVQNGGKKERCGFGAKYEGAKRSWLKSCGPGATQFGWGKIPFGANEEIEREGLAALAGRSKEGR
jgi:hypothetical protein